MATWCELRLRLQQSETIDKFAQEKLRKEKEYWKSVIFRIIAIVKYLAIHNLALRGKKDKLYENSNGNFLGLIEMLAEFGPLMKEHVERINSGKVHHHYLTHDIQNDHQEQMSLISRCVDGSSNSFEVCEVFIEFLQFNDLSGQGLFKVLENVLNTYDLDIDDVTGQGYDNGSNMKATQWESRVECIKAIRFQILDIREALLEVAQVDNDNMIKSEAKSLAKNELGSFEFLLATVIWYEILHVVNLVSKQLQSIDMLIDVAISEIKGLISFLKKYRENGFSGAMNIAKDIANKIGIDPVFPQTRIIRRKRHFDKINGEETLLSPEETFRIQYFLYIVDKAIASLEKRFEHFELYENVFGFLFNSDKLISMDDNELQSCCIHFEDALKNGESSDINGSDLFVELKLVRELLPKQKWEQ
ncbi:uncharacterized protein LOC110703029 [Chenopodium quinoa]|uniref:uncharacterized protein LOC110703029 n=1 Tax=Chenopodium quinoa TaxID=63459 RepID=UPI000B777B35|nr:uncharacterized protein LOC110703029 [Chenopodium quinoa]